MQTRRHPACRVSQNPNESLDELFSAYRIPAEESRLVTRTKYWLRGGTTRADKDKLLRRRVNAKCHVLIKISSRVGPWKRIIPFEQPARVHAAREIYPQITGSRESARDRIVERDLNRRRWRRQRRRTLEKHAGDNITDNTNAGPLNCPRDERLADKRAARNN